MWTAAAAHLAPAENVRVALAYVARGEAPLGIVYRTDALIEPAVRIVATFPDSSHTPIVYPAALIKGARPGAAAFLAFLRRRRPGRCSKRPVSACWRRPAGAEARRGEIGVENS